MKYLCLLTIVSLISPAYALKCVDSGVSRIAIQEYNNINGNGGTSTKFAGSEFIEFAITEPMTAAELASLTFGNTNSSTNILQGVFRFDLATLTGILSNASLDTFMPGTLIVVKGTNLGPQNLSYNPTSGNITDNDAWSIELTAGLGAADHPEATVDGIVDASRNGSVVWISSDNPPSNNTDADGFIFAIGHDASPGDVANAVITEYGNNHILPIVLAEGQYVANTGDYVVSLTESSVGTMGAPNSIVNETWMNALRACGLQPQVVPEPSRAILLLAGALGCLMRRRR
jgi:hypothetical protein